MSVIFGMVRALLGMFVDDGSLALAIIGVVAAAALLALAFATGPILVGTVLILGCLAVLAVNVASAATAPKQ